MPRRMSQDGQIWVGILDRWKREKEQRQMTNIAAGTHITAWSLAWLSRTMPACAFWYYRTEAEARAEAAAMADYKTKVRAVQVPADFDRWAR